MDIKGVIFDYGGTIDSRGDHWSEIIRDGCLRAGATFSREAFREAYVATERYLATHPVVSPDFDFMRLMQAKTATEARFLRDGGNCATDAMADEAARYCYDRARECVEESRAVIEDVTGTATHFILRKYKEKHIIFEKRPEQEKEWIFV